MTLPDERYRAVLYAEQFLKDLLDPKKTPRVPKSIRQQAYSILRHYPSKYHLDTIATQVPSMFETRDPIDELTLMVLQYEEQRHLADK